jgi:mannose/fructose-specific phosphotransferase system component IIA
MDVHKAKTDLIAGTPVNLAICYLDSS